MTCRARRDGDLFDVALWQAGHGAPPLLGGQVPVVVADLEEHLAVVAAVAFRSDDQ